MKSLFGITTLFVSMLMHAQLTGQTYSFSTYQADYVSVGVGFPLTEDVWDDPNYVVPLGYSFDLFDDMITNLESIESYTGGGVMAAVLDGTIASVIGVYGPDIIDRGYYTGTSQSAIYFAYAGTPGQRVFIQEWLNVGFANGDTANGVFTDYVNFQLQLHEASREILFHFGTSSITNPIADYEGYPGPSLGLLKEVDISGAGIPDETFLLAGDPAQPTIITEFMPVTLNGSIPENTVYRFKQAGTSVKDNAKQQVVSVFYPNPSSGELWIREGYADKISYPIQVFSAQGMLVKEFFDANQLTTDDLPSGIYQVRFKTDESWDTERIVVMN